MNQSKLESLLEVIFNVFLGWVIGFSGQIILYPLIGIQASISQNFVASVIFTVISIARGYVIRRWFNYKIKNVISTVARSYER